MKYIHSHAHCLVKTSGAESLIDISNWMVGWSGMVPSRFDNPDVRIHVQNDVTESPKTS